MFMCGQSQAHSNFPAFNGTPAIITQNGNAHIFSAAAQIQGAIHALVPAIGIQKNGMSPNINPTPSGTPPFSNVPDAPSMVGLFSSAASQLANRLMDPHNQLLYQQYYTALMGLTRWSGRPTYATATADAKTALELVVQNLGNQLMVQPGQETTWGGMLATMDAKLKPLADSMIIALNAFSLGLTAQVTTGAMFDDPHGNFAGPPPEPFDDSLAMLMDSFQTQANMTADKLRGGGHMVGERLVCTIHGDTLKNPHQRSGWPDGTPGGSNVLFVQGAGYLPGGWFGDITAMNRVNFDPMTGAANAMAPTAQCTSAACGAVLFAVSGGSTDIARMYYSADLGNLIIKSALT